MSYPEGTKVFYVPDIEANADLSLTIKEMVNAYFDPVEQRLVRGDKRTTIRPGETGYLETAIHFARHVIDYPHLPEQTRDSLRLLLQQYDQIATLNEDELRQLVNILLNSDS